MRSLIFGSSGATNLTANYYIGLSMNASSQSTAPVRSNVMPCDGTISNLMFYVNNAPGAGTSRTFTVYINGSPTAMAVTISNTSQSATYAGSLSYSAGDLVSIRNTVSGAVAATTCRQSVVNTTSVIKKSILFSGDLTNPQVANYFMPIASPGVGNSTENLVQNKIPCAGTISDMYVYQTAAPGTGKAQTYTVYLNGNPTSLTVTISNSATTGNDTDAGHAISVVAGDLVAVTHAPTSTPANAQSSIGCIFTASTDGQFPMMSTAVADQADNTTTNYIFSSGGTSWNTTEALRIHYGQTFLMKDMYVELGTAPDTGNSFTYQFRKTSGSSGNGNLVVTISGTNKTGSDTTHSDEIASGDLIDIAAIPDSGPTLSTRTHIGVVGMLQDVTTTIADTISLSDANTEYPTKSLADTISLSDANTEYVAKGLADTISLADDNSKSVGVALADTISLADAINSIRGLYLDLADTISLVDSETKYFVKSLADTIGLTDLFARTVYYVRTLSDTIGLTDAFSYVSTVVNNIKNPYKRRVDSFVNRYKFKYRGNKYTKR